MIRNSDIDRLRGLFAKRLIATMDMLKKTVGTVADLAVFRKLRELDYCTSYSHRGRFYTLQRGTIGHRFLLGSALVHESA